MTATATCLGSVRLAVNGKHVRLTPTQAVALATLVAVGPEGCTRARLYQELFAGNPQASGDQAAVMRIRRLAQRLAAANDDVPLIVQGERYALDETACDVDVWSFAVGVELDDPVELLDSLKRWSDPFAGLVEVPPVVGFASEQLGQSHRRGLIRFGSMITPAFGDEGLPLLLEEMERDPYDETLAATTAAALYRLGRQPAALNVIKRCRSHLLDEFGLAAGTQIDKIELAILNHDATMLAATHPSASIPDSVAEQAMTLPEARRFVGHEEAVSAMMQARDHFLEGGMLGSRFWLVEGEAGVGKSSLLAKVFGSLDGADLVVRVGRVDGSGGDRASGSVYGALLQALPELAEDVRLLERGADYEHGRSRFWQRVQDRLSGLNRQGSVVVILDDMHNADSQLIALIRYLATLPERSEVLFVLASRPERPEEPTQWAETVRSLGDAVTTVCLEPLSLDDIDELVALDHPDEAPIVRRGFAEQVLALSQGNTMIASTLSRDAQRGLEITRLPDSVEPEANLAQHLAAKVGDAELRQILSVAAIIGMEFDPALIGYVVDRDEAWVVERLREAADAALCITDGRSWRFDHLLTLGFFSRQVRLLRPIVCGQLALETSRGGVTTMRYVLDAGHHLETAQAVRLLLDAVEEFEGRQAFSEMVTGLEAVLARLDDEAANATSAERSQFASQFDGDRFRLDVLLRLAAASSRKGDLDRARYYRRLGFDLARSQNDHEAMFEAAVAGLPSGEYVGGESDRLDMLNLVDLERAPTLAPARLARWKIRLCRLNDDAAQEAELVASIDPTWRETNPQDWVELQLSVVSFEAIGRSGALIYERLLQLAEEAVSPSLRASILFRAATAALAEQRPDAVSKGYAAAAAAIHHHGSPRNRWSLEVLAAAMNEVGIGGFDRPDATPESARVSGMGWGIPDVFDAWGVQLYAEKWFGGRLGEALALLDVYKKEIAVNVGWEAAEAYAAAWVGDIERARDQIKMVIDMLADSQRILWLPPAAALLIEAAVIVGDREAAEVGEEILQIRSGQAIILGVGVAHLGPVDRYLGLAATLTGNGDPQALLQAAVDQTDRAGVPFWRDRTASDLQRIRSG